MAAEHGELRSEQKVVLGLSITTIVAVKIRFDGPAFLQPMAGGCILAVGIGAGAPSAGIGPHERISAKYFTFGDILRSRGNGECEEQPKQGKFLTHTLPSYDRR